MVSPPAHLALQSWGRIRICSKNKAAGVVVRGGPEQGMRQVSGNYGVIGKDYFLGT